MYVYVYNVYVYIQRGRPFFAKISSMLTSEQLPGFKIYYRAIEINTVDGKRMKTDAETSTEWEIILTYVYTTCK